MQSRPFFAPLRWMSILAVAWCASSCSSLPRVHPDMALRTSRVPPISGVRGPLSAERAKAVLAGLKKGSGGDTDVLDRHLALEAAVADSPLVVGNKAVLLQDGPATYKAMFAAIHDAHDHVNLESYIVEDDDVGQHFLQALVAKQRQGVQVNLIYDSVGSLGTPSEFFQPLIDAGAHVLQFNPVNPLIARTGWNVNQRDHRKLLVTDGRIAFVGGVNISSVYSSGSAKPVRQTRPEGGLPWRDTQIQIEGPVVAEFQKLFLQTWVRQKGPALPDENYFPPPEARGKEVVHALGGSPEEPYSTIYATLISAIDNAEGEILLSNAYFAPDPQLRAALKAAVARGVDVKLILPSQTDSWLIFHAGRSYYEEMLSAGVQIYERKEALLHSKTALIDGVWSTVGSTNLDWRSFVHNQEINAVVLGADFGAQMRAAFDRDLAASQRITLDQWHHRALGLRMKEAAARLWEYWL